MCRHHAGGGALYLVTVAAVVYKPEGKVEEWEAASFSLPPTRGSLFTYSVHKEVEVS